MRVLNCRIAVQLYIIEFILFVLLTTPKDLTLPNLPFGIYRVIINKLYPCELTTNHLIKFDGVFRKKTMTIFEARGNLTLKTPFDNTLDLDIRAASWGTIGGWKENVIVIKSPHACDTTKNLVGDYWFVLQKEFGPMSEKCPIPVGTYTTTGIEINPDNLNYPKVFFYGKYKGVSKIRNQNGTLIGCLVVEFDLVRPWEAPNQ